MNMSSYEVVRRAIEFERPDRLPLCFNALGISDVHCVNWNQIGTGDSRLKETVDEWGCHWVRTEIHNMGQVKYHPLFHWDQFHKYVWPDPDNPLFYEGMEDRFADSGDKYILTYIFMLLFERMHTLHGFENTLIDLLRGSRKIEMLADQIVEFDLGIIKNIAKRFPKRIHGLSFSDDWGTQQALFINPNLWNSFFKPRYDRIIDAAHKQGWHVWMHSCGKINAIIESLIDIGLDVINLQQPRALGIVEVGKLFSGRICFETSCDIQQTLPSKGDSEIREESSLLLKHWATPKGGFILSDYGDDESIGIKPEKKKTMLDAFLQADPYTRQ